MKLFVFVSGLCPYVFGLIKPVPAVFFPPLDLAATVF